MVDAKSPAMQQLWLDLAKKLAVDPYAQVRCPEKDDGIVQVQDVIAPDGIHFDRYLTCPICGARRTVSGIAAITNLRKDATDLSAARDSKHTYP